MAIIGNRTLQALVIGTQMGAAAAYMHRGVTSPESRNNGRFFGGFSKEFGTPAGSHPIHSIVIPLVDGGLRAEGAATGSGTAAGYAGRVMVGSGAATGSGTAAASAVSSVAAASGSATGSGSAAAGGAVNAVGSGSATGSGAVLMGAIINILGASGTGTGSGTVTLTAIGEIIAEGGGGTELSPSSLAAAVWSAVATDNNDTGTMGEKLNDAGGAGNPWAALVEDNGDPGTFGERVAKLLKLAQYLGLK